MVALKNLHSCSKSLAISWLAAVSLSVTRAMSSVDILSIILPTIRKLTAFIVAAMWSGILFSEEMVRRTLVSDSAM